MVPGRIRLVGGVMTGGVGLATASAVAEGDALATPGVGRLQAPSVMASNALSARRLRSAAVISPLLARTGLLSWPKLATQFYDRRPRSAHQPYAEPLASHTCRPAPAACRRGGGGSPWRACQSGAAGKNPAPAGPPAGRSAG